MHTRMHNYNYVACLDDGMQIEEWVHKKKQIQKLLHVFLSMVIIGQEQTFWYNVALRFSSCKVVL